MKKRLLALLLALSSVFALATGCGERKKEQKDVDYAASVKLDMNSETLKQEVEVKLYIDGDTTHFFVPTTISADGVLKARYLAVNTPESTGKIEEWGKKASKFTKEKLMSATSIILETDGTKWEKDSTGDRHLVWVWYKPEGATDYRNLNIEILQNGLAFASNSGGNRYGETCLDAIAQATKNALHIHSKEKDPDFFYGSAIEMDLKELRLNVAEYDGMKVAFEGVVTYLYNNGAYIENYDEETGIWYGMYVYYGFTLSPDGQEIVFPGNKVRIVGTVSYYEAGDSYQVSGLQYSPFDIGDPNNIQNLDPENDYAPVHLLTSAADFTRTVEIHLEDEETARSYKYPEVALHSSISMKGLKVKSIYTTNNGGSNDGAMTITCELDGKEIVVRTDVLRDENGDVVTASKYLNKTIDVKGVIDYFKAEGQEKGGHQIKVFDVADITVH